jgi:hypothetical protein
VGLAGGKQHLAGGKLLQADSRVLGTARVHSTVPALTLESVSGTGSRPSQGTPARHIKDACESLASGQVECLRPAQQQTDSGHARSHSKVVANAAAVLIVASVLGDLLWAQACMGG